jgi:hypothetical protein
MTPNIIKGDTACTGGIEIIKGTANGSFKKSFG